MVQCVFSVFSFLTEKFSVFNARVANRACIATPLYSSLFLSSAAETDRKWQRGRFCCVRCLLKLTTRIASNFAGKSGERAKSFSEPLRVSSCVRLVCGQFLFNFRSTFVQFLLSFSIFPLCFRASFSVFWCSVPFLVPICVLYCRSPDALGHPGCW